MDTAFEAQAFTILAMLTALLLVIVTGGVLYLTAVEWRDRRRRQQAQKSAPSPRRKS